VVSKSFGQARHEVTGDSWLDDLYRASLAAAEAKFSDDLYATPQLRVELPGLRDLDAHSSFTITKAVQDATTKMGHIIRDPRRETSMAHAADRARARLVQRGQAGNVIVFGFPPSSFDVEVADDFAPHVETLAERAVRELVTVLPRSSDDDASLDAVLAQRLTVRNAVGDIANAVPSKARALDFKLTPQSGEPITSVLSAEQARVLKDSLSESRVETRTYTVPGRLDGVRTRRRIFYLEPDSGPEIHGAIDLELLESVRDNLNRHVLARLHEETIRSVGGKRSRPVYRLLELQESPRGLF
jgi:hypothetical protein